MRTRTVLAVSVALALVLGASGCGSDDEVKAGDPDPTTTTTTAPSGGDGTDPGSDTGSDATTVGFRVVDCCGFVPVDFNVAYVPTLSIMADGTVVVTGAVPDIYPGPALPNLQTGTVDPAVVDDLARQAADAGLLADDVDFGEPAISDMPTTVATVLVDGEPQEISVYALGMDMTEGLTAEQIANRAAVTDLISAGQEAAAQATQAYGPTGVTVYAFPLTEPSPDNEGEGMRTNLTWPMDDPAQWPQQTYGAGCRTYTGADAATVLSAAAGANQLTAWVTPMKGGEPTTAPAGEPLHLVFRPLLPDETDLCGAGG